jgi:hypothetical protein
VAPALVPVLAWCTRWAMLMEPVVMM